MTGIKTSSSRRAFFLRGGAVLGVGVAAAGAAPMPEPLVGAEDREAIRRLHLAFTSLIESQGYEAAAELFDEQARLQLGGVTAEGKPAILQLLVDQYRHQKAATIHAAYRPNALQRQDTLNLSESRRQATARYHVDVAVNTPLHGDSTAATMARLQGQMADRRWETGRIEAKYVKTQGQWKMAALHYAAS